MSQPAISLVDVSKAFGRLQAVQSLSLDVQAGELLAVVGPSGCGKTTLLRLIAGLERPTSGKLFIAGRDAARSPPWQRNVAMVFQNFPLYPHWTVADNIAFGLKRLGLAKPERSARIAAAADAMRIGDLLARMPHQLSGGQQQRAALAKAIARRPNCLLLDEPLSNLDEPLREDLRKEIRRLPELTGAAVIHVTHDRREALAVADRVAVMEAGRLATIAPPAELGWKLA